MAVRTVPFETKGMDNVDDFITMIESFLGYLEKANGKDLGDFTAVGKTANAGYNNYTVYWDWYKFLGYGNMQAQPYCAGFVSTVLSMAYGLENAKKLLCGNLFIFCPDAYNQFKKVGRTYSTPKRGDVVLFWSTSLGRWGHTGIVVGVDATGYTTIEANTSSGNDIVVRNGGATCRKHYTLGQTKEIFCRPPYEDLGISLSKPGTSMITYSIGTGQSGLTIVADKINVRTEPGSTSSSTVRKTLKYGDKFYPTLKTFINGDAWIYDPAHGWMSASYVEGWMQEFTCDNKWWFVKKGYTCVTNAIVEIGSEYYYFDAAGYMLQGTITFKTDENGALKVNK